VPVEERHVALVDAVPSTKLYIVDELDELEKEIAIRG
jgi:hypothetical protein